MDSDTTFIPFMLALHVPAHDELHSQNEPSGLRLITERGDYLLKLSSRYAAQASGNNSFGVGLPFRTEAS